ncbi:uncharacterized protein EDB91DRAFT_1085849 [Suillus paluster]|uniref:uncharacterized protein n=1 Tax=Suillus paluster TaxID=48578 RepID=UPI001B86867A|nr:uncharacterized protein EDB91DRAFT_1085849 [Suillus paluster]KAG1729067.1 hypothetical protein EDB91DRAFT_1085849 [Suillus paluster]
MEEVEILKQDKATKQRKTTYYVSQGRAICQMVTLYIPIEDIITENDRHCENGNSSSTLEQVFRQDRFQCGYVELIKVLPWFHDKLASLDLKESEEMLRKLKRGIDSACGDNTGTLKELVASWVNVECHLPSLIRTHDKHSQGFNGAGRTQLSGLAFVIVQLPSLVLKILGHHLCMKTIKQDTTNLERSLFKSKLLVMGFKAIFISPSSANEVDGDGNGTDIIIFAS